ncbi:hypothetical protein L1049_011576 [Liquidambar formosana]|uniref:Myb-like domain-containing protein n=1 Tax=Liquidambar formosana TaxID=63359 RepID=A0AAP0RWP8_LIQFO
MEMGDQYGLPDLTQLMARRTHFPAISQPTVEPFSVHRNLTPPQYYEAIMVGRRHTGHDVFPRGLVEFGTDNYTTSTPTTTTAATSAGGLCGLEMEGAGIAGGDGGNSRWPRQETLTLLEIRSRLDSNFKEANQKGPLWDEVSRIMAEEHGFQRSGKKCREKFENLYKYYKKTKEGKAGRQDGKHYRFFRQLEALYGETSNASASVSEINFVGNTLPYHSTNNITIDQANQEATLQDQKLCESLSFTNSSELETSSSENNDDDLSAIAFMMNHSTEKKKTTNDNNQCLKRGKKSWKAKIEEFVDSHIKKLMESQEAWMEKMLKTIEHNEHERMCREEEWRKQEAARVEREYKFWANERAWVEARDTALVEALKKLTGKELKLSSSPPQELVDKIVQLDHKKNKEDSVHQIPYNSYNRWREPEISSLIQLRMSMEQRFQESGCMKDGLWDEISAKMACMGYGQSGISCKEKWENMSIYFGKTMECNKKRKETSRSSNYFQQLLSYQPLNDEISPSNSTVGAAMHDGSFRTLMDEGEHLWENYGVKLNKERNQ